MSSTIPSLLFSVLLLLLFTSHLPSSSAACNKADAIALLAFKNSFPPDSLTSWSPDSDCCDDWNGITCDSITGRLYGIDFTFGPGGPIPPSVGGFPTLQVLRFHKIPDLVGPIPREITALKKLRALTVSWTNISGPVPSFLSELPSLQRLDLSFNNLSGSLPPSLGDLPGLIVVDVSRNHLTGEIPANLFHKTKDMLPTLILSHNKLTGEIPKALGEVGFATIDVSRNGLTGDASVLFGKSKPTQGIIISRNYFRFDLTKVEFPEVNFYDLDISHNEIYGRISEQVTKVANLQLWNVSYNRLCGEIPSGGKMAAFDASSYVHNECLCGTPLPACK